MKKLIFVTIVILSLSACYYNNIEEFGCNTNAMTYSGNVTSILKTSCYNCHAAPAGAGGGVILDNYADVKISVDNGSLLGSIKHDTLFKAMPRPTGLKLDDCTIEKIASFDHFY